MNLAMRGKQFQTRTLAGALLFALAAALGLADGAAAQATDQTRIVDSRTAIVRFNAGTYTFDEGAGTVTNQISLIARTLPNSIPPLRGFSVRVSTRAHSASSGDDYGSFSRWVTFRGGLGNWVDVGNAYESEVRLAVRIVGDHLDEDDETFGLLLGAPNDPLSTIGIAPADLDAGSRCTSDGCESLVTIVDDDTRGVMIGHTGMIGVPEGGDVAYSVMLETKPTDDVTVTPEVRDAIDAEVSVSRTLIFTPSNWNRPQKVTVEAEADENRVDGSAMVTHAVAGGDYGENGVTGASVAVREEDREADMVHSGDVTIAAIHPTALQGIDRLGFVVTRSVAADYDLDVPVTLSSGIVETDRLSHTVTIAANEASANLRVSTRAVEFRARTGDVTATVGNGDNHDVGDPSTAPVRLHIGETLVTVRFSAASYDVPESAGTTTNEVLLIARTEPGIPAPYDAIELGMWAQARGTADTQDFFAFSRPQTVPGESRADWVADGETYELETRAPVAIVDDDFDEEDETLELRLWRPPAVFPTVSVVEADSTAPPCVITDECTSTLTIVDDDTRGVTVSQTDTLSVEEDGRATYTVVLDSRPTSEVTITPVVQDAADAQISVSRALRFEPRMWRFPKTVTVRVAADENAVDGSATITHTVEGGDYGNNGVTAASVQVAEEDREADLEHSGNVTIAATHPTALQAIDDLLFTVTRAVTADYDLEVPVTLSSGVIDADRLSHTVTIGANETAAELRLHTRALDAAAATGDVTATVGDGVLHDVGDPPTATVTVYVGEPLVTVRLNADRYMIGEDVGTTGRMISVIATTEANIPAPTGTVGILVSTRGGTAASPDDYGALSEEVVFGGESGGAWTAVDDAYQSEVVVPVTIVNDDVVEGDETFRLLLERTPSTPATVEFRPAHSMASEFRPALSRASECRLGGCESDVTIVDDDDEPADPVVVTLVHVPDGTVIPANSNVAVSGTVVDGTTFGEDELVSFRLLFSAADGGPAPGGADVELSFDWHHDSPIVPISGEISRIVLSLPRVDVWDSSVQILDNDVGNPDSTLTIRITGCERNRCVIGEPSEITVTITDDDGGPAAAVPGRLEPPRLVCASAGAGYDPTGVAASWQAPAFVGGAPIEGYDVQYQRRIAGGDPWVWGEWQAWPHTGTATTTTIAGLDTDTLYGVRVRAVNANGPGQWSLPNTFWTGEPDQICDILDRLAESQ